MGMERSDNLQTVSLEDYEPQLWTCVNCFCGFCVQKCPAYVELQNEAVTARGIAQIGLSLLVEAIALSELSDELLYACTGCGWCEFECSLNTPAVIRRTGNRKTKISGATTTEILRSMNLERGVIPKAVKDALENIVNLGNPYGGPRAAKAKWVEALGCKFGGESTVLYVGSTVPYEDRATKMAESLIFILKKANVKFFMNGSEDNDSGAFARYMGEEGLFEQLVEKNSRLFRENRAEKIICLSPHDYDVFVRFYELDGVDIQHYTKTLWELIEDGRIELRKEINKTITYQDPCYLGRKHNIYDQPRSILKSIKGATFVEMNLNKERAYCCGGGGAGLWYPVPNVDMNYTRVDHAEEKNVQYLAVACPICLQMLDDGVKARDYEAAVKDISEIVVEAL